MSIPARACDRAAVATLIVATAVLLAVVLVAHPIPLLGVETDLLGDSIPAARAIGTGRFTAESFQFRGPGYPLLLLGVSQLAGGDEFLAARLLNVVAAVGSLAAAYLMFRAFLGPLIGLAVMLGLLANPVFVSAAIEAGTDMPALALALTTTWLVTRPGGWRACAAAGAVAGWACLTRYNMVFLIPAGVATLAMLRLETRRDAAGGVRGEREPGREERASDRARLGRMPRRAYPGGVPSSFQPERAGSRILAFAAGLLVPIGGWMLAHAIVAGGLPHNQNFVNVAYEVYGQGMGYERFWVRTGNAFRSFADVVSYDPARFALHVGRNALTRWIEDAHRLMPVWIGAPAVIGMALTWRRPGWAAMLIHAGLAYLVLSLVFYTPRFFLYLLPFYLSGTLGLLLARPPAPGAGRAAGAKSVPLARIGIAGALLLISAVATVAASRRLLADPPEETRVAGEILRGVGAQTQRVMARKPHAAFHAGMQYVPIPYAEALADFLAEATRARADYLVVSATETGLVPQLSVLVDPGVSLPGLVPIAHRVLGENHYLALYRFDPAGAPRAVFEDSLLGAIRRFAARRPGQAFAQAYLGGQLVTMGRHREALEPLGLAERLDPRDALTARFQAVAHFGLGEFEPAAAACERALALVPTGSWEQGYLGEIRLRQGRFGEARDRLRQAMDGAPTDPRYPILYLEACAGAGSWPEAAAIAEQLLRSTPGDASVRFFAARAWLALGRPDQARALAARPDPAAGPDSTRWAALADSLRATSPPTR